MRIIVGYSPSNGIVPPIMGHVGVHVHLASKRLTLHWERFSLDLMKKLSSAAAKAFHLALEQLRCKPSVLGEPWLANPKYRFIGLQWSTYIWGHDPIYSRLQGQLLFSLKRASSTKHTKHIRMIPPLAALMCNVVAEVAASGSDLAIYMALFESRVPQNSMVDHGFDQ